ncbi:MAG: T9SS type A sorting domain-containing protein [Saprospirales bacterium]|nr:T9SS type A sorting domain-containing protein [Saprospirales bacterium]
MTDPLGRSLRTKTGEATNGYFRESIDLRGLAAGLYFVRVQHEGRVWVKEVLVLK